MWCPKCKSEFRDGITFCVECNTPLVEKLPQEVDISAVEQKVEVLNNMDGQESLNTLKDSSHAYVEKSVKYEDMKSTACSFLLVGACGVLLLVLALTGVIPLQLAEYMKYMMTFVIGGMFLVFLIIGFRSYAKLSDLKMQMITEQQEKEAAKSWFFEHYSGRAIDVSADAASSDELHQKYFIRSSYMKQVLQKQFPDYEDSFLDYLTEQFYEELYPQD